METLNALTCCRGFALQDKSRFWRHHLAEMCLDLDISTQNSFYELNDNLFSRYHVCVDVDTDTDRIASGIAFFFSMNPKSQAHGVRDTIHDVLRPYFTRNPPPLELELELTWRRQVRKDWSLAKRTLWDLNCTLRQGTKENRFREKVTIVIGNAKYDGRQCTAKDLLDICDTLTVETIELRELHVNLVKTSEGDVLKLSTGISAVLRELICVNTLKRMPWKLPHRDSSCIAAIAQHFRHWDH